MKIAVPRFGEYVAPCFGYSSSIVVFTAKNKRIVNEQEFTLSTQWAVDRIRLLRDQEVDVLICGGIQDKFEDIVMANGIRVISWVSGKVENLLDEYLNHKLIPEKQETK